MDLLNCVFDSILQASNFPEMFVRILHCSYLCDEIGCTFTITQKQSFEKLHAV